MQSCERLQLQYRQMNFNVETDYSIQFEQQNAKGIAGAPFKSLIPSSKYGLISLDQNNALVSLQVLSLSQILTIEPFQRMLREQQQWKFILNSKAPLDQLRVANDLYFGGNFSFCLVQLNQIRPKMDSVEKLRNICIAGQRRLPGSTVSN